MSGIDRLAARLRRIHWSALLHGLLCLCYSPSLWIGALRAVAATAAFRQSIVQAQQTVA